MGIFLFIILLVTCSIGAHGIIVIDQEQTVIDSAFTANNSGQSFRPSLDNITGALVYIKDFDPTNGPGDFGNDTLSIVRLFLFNHLPDSPGGYFDPGITHPYGSDFLATGSVTVGLEEWATVFWDPVTVTPGSTYFLMFFTEGRVGGVSTGEYPDGIPYSDTPFQSYPLNDIAFRTYSEISEPIPEPATLVLVLAGLVGVGCVRRKKSNFV